MCETARDIARHPQTQRKIIDISRICQRLTKYLRQHKEGAHGMGRSNA